MRGGVRLAAFPGAFSPKRTEKKRWRRRIYIGLLLVIYLRFIVPLNVHLEFAVYLTSRLADPIGEL